jgi:hypothetical protein
MKQYINEAKRMQKLAGLEVKDDANTGLNESQIRSLVREIVEEAVYSSGDVNAILKAAKEAIAAGKTVTVDEDGTPVKIDKVVQAFGALHRGDGQKWKYNDRENIFIKDLIGEPERIKIDGKPAELKPMEDKPTAPKADTRTPEEKAKAQSAFDDRYGPNGGVQTAFGKYTGD